MPNPRLAPRAPLFASPGSPPVEWVVSAGLIAYPEAVAEMEARAERIAAGRAPERVWLLEHPPLYTAGASAKPEGPPRPEVSGLSDRARRAVHLSRARPAGRLCDARPQAPPAGRARLCRRPRGLADRGAEGLRRRGRDARGPGRGLGRPARRSPAPPTAASPRTRSPRSACACAAGRPFTGSRSMSRRTLRHFSGIVPCGIRSAQYGVTSLADLGRKATLAEADAALTRRVREHVRADRRDPRRGLNRLFAPASRP